MSNFIIVTEKYALGSDSNQWKIFRKITPTKKNPKGWESFNYYATIGGAVKGLADRLIRESDESSVLGLSRAATDITNMLREKFTQLEIEVK